MVDLGQGVGEPLEDLGLELAPERIRAPHLAHERGRGRFEPVGPEREGKRQLAGGADRLALGKEGANHSRSLALNEQGFLGAATDGGADRPVRVVAHEREDPLGPDEAAVADRHPFAQCARRRVGQVRPGAVAGPRSPRR